MPQSLAIGAFVLGGVLLLLSVVRGGFKIFGAEVSGSAGNFGRIVAFVCGVVLIATGFFTDRPNSARGQDAGSQAPISQAPTSTQTEQRPLVPRTVQSPSPRDDRPTETQTSANTHASIQ